MNNRNKSIKNKTSMRKTAKKKLNLNDISRCNPALLTTDTARKNKYNITNGQCLPNSVYSDIKSALQLNTSNTRDNVFKMLGCDIGAEHCLIDKAPLNDNHKRELRKQYLRPRRPAQWEKDPDMWLDNYNIMNVMKQYQDAFKWFKFLGVFPIDFSAPDPYAKNGNGNGKCLYEETCNINLKNEYNNGIRGIGMVFNLDPHFKGGSHWVALYIDLQNINKPFVGYFDSYGYKTPPLIARLMRSFRLQINTCELGYNARRFQFGNSECGMFSLYFIICMIHDIPFRDFCKDTVNDTFMLELRNILFAK
jgi:hypothetical protein